MIHFDIEPFCCFVRKEFLYDFKSGHGMLVPCKVFAVASYPGHALTFNILVNGQFTFSYIPVHALCITDTAVLYELGDATYFNCPDGELVTHKFSLLTTIPCHVFNRDHSYRGVGKYLMTFDWHLDNLFFHLIEQGGQYILWPNHKLVFSETVPTELPDYKKLHKEWIIPSQPKKKKEI